MENVLSRRLSGLFACIVAVGVLVLVQTASATIIVYDGFAEGGTADGRATNATLYTSFPSSTNGLNYSSLHTQSPISTGFPDDAMWDATNGIVAASSYFQAQGGGLIYTNFAPYTKGIARFFRSSGSYDTLKTAVREATTTDLSDVQWVAMLVDFRNAPSTNTMYQDFTVTLEYGEPGDASTPYDGAWTPATFGVRRSDGKAFYRTATGTSKVDAYTDYAVSAGTHLFLLKFDDREGTGGTDRYDDVTFWFDPVLTEDPNDLIGGMSAVSIMRSDLSGGMHAFDEIRISAALQSVNVIAFDEFIITDDYSDIFTNDTRAAFQSVGATHIRSRFDDYYDYRDSNFNDSQELIVGPTSTDIIRGLIEFDVSSIPSSDKITSASLFLSTHPSSVGINDVAAPGDLTDFNVYAYVYDIDATTATWNVPDVNTNDVPGGTSGALLSSASVDVEIAGSKITFEDTAAFRDAVEDALEADGFLRLIIRGADETVGTHNFARFASEDMWALDLRPELLVSHMYVTPAGTVILVH